MKSLVNKVKSIFKKEWIIEDSQGYKYSLKLVDFFPALGPKIHCERNRKKGFNEGESFPAYLFFYQIPYLISAYALAYYLLYS